MNKIDTILSLVQDVVFEFDRKGTYLGIWAKDESLLAKPRDFMLGKKISDVLPEEESSYYIDMINSVLDSQKEMPIAYCIETPRGSTHFKGSIIPLPADSEEKTVVLFATDVTDHVKLKQAFDDQKSRLDHILTNTDSVAFECLYEEKSDLDFSFVSDKAKELLGDPNTDNQNFFAKLKNSIKEDCLQDFFSAFLTSSKDLHKLDWQGQIKTQHSEERWIQILSTPMRINEKQVIFYGIILDITKRKNSEIELEKKERILSHQMKLASLGELAAGIGHEINNPLNIILNVFKKTVRELDTPSYGTDKLKDLLELGIESTTRISKITNGLKVFTRNDSEDFESFELGESLQTTVNLISEICSNKNITLNFNNLTGTCFVKGIRGKIDQVIMNLVSNAIDALADKKNGVISVSLEAKNDKGHIFVSDNGNGIPKNIQSKIFDPFFTSKEVGKGTGIGLSLAHSIILEHDGDITFETSSEGTVFKVILPVCIERS